MNNIFHSIVKSNTRIKGIMHNNIYMIIGCYGVLAIIIIYLSIKWLFHIELMPIFIHNLPPAWQSNGDLAHPLGTDNLGHDILNYLFISYKTTLILTLRATLFVIIIGTIMNYLIFFIPFLRTIIAIFFRFIIAIPPLLSAIMIALIWDNHINSILLIIGLSYLPRFVHNINNQIIQEWQKTYIIAHRLDGLSTPKILNCYILPNILPAYLTEVVALFSHIILALTILTFLGFANNLGSSDLGTMMYHMLSIIHINYWPFFASGITIIITIVFIHLLSLGVHMMSIKRVEN